MRIFCAVAVLCCAVFSSQAWAEEKKVDGPKCFELRIYTAAEGKFEALMARFRNHTLKLFEKHGIKVVGFWAVSEGPDAGKKLYYINEYPNRAARDAAFTAFRNDPDWKKAKSESEVNGSLTAKVEEVFLTATDLSLIK